MKDKIKIVFFDIDGTLYNHYDLSITKSSIKALKELKNNGYIIAIATGRPIEMVKILDRDLHSVDFDYMITSNGQSIYQKDECLYKNYIDKRDTRKIVNLALQEGLIVNLVGDNFNVINKITDQVRLSFDAIGSRYPDVVDLTNYYDKNIDHLVCYNNNSYIAKFESIIEHSKITYWSDSIFDFVPNNGVKAHGISILLDRLNLRSSQAMAFGDGNNDIEMIEYVGLGVAMGNSVPDLKDIADYVCDSIDNDGIFKALKKYRMI